MPESSARLVRWGAWIVGAVLLFAAVQKAADLAFDDALVGSHGDFYFPDHRRWLDGLEQLAILPELILGVTLLSSRPARKSVLAAIAFVGLLTAITGGLALYGHSTALCNCLGSRIHLPVFWHLALNGAMLATLGLCHERTLATAEASPDGG